MIELANEQIERHLLGCMLVDPKSIDQVTGIVAGSDFAHFPAVFRLLVELHDNGDLLGGVDDARLITEAMRERGLLESFGGVASIAKLCSAVPGHAKRYAEQVQQLSNRRRVLDMLTQGIQRIESGDDWREVSESVHAELDIVSNRQSTEFKTIGEIMAESLADLRKPTRPMIYSGLEKLDRYCGGFAAGELVIVAAGPGGGKSAFGLQVAYHNARRFRPVLFLTFEMQASEEAKRIWAMQTEITVNQLRRRDLSDQDFQELEQIASNESETTLHVHYQASPKWRDVERLIKAYRARHKPALIVVDYVGLVARSDSRQTTQEKIAEVTGGLKAMAGRLECPIIALVQVNREGMKAGRINLHNMADSSSVERDADIVIAIQNDPENEEDESARVIEILKHRHGQTGIMRGFSFDGARMSFSESCFAEFGGVAG